MTPRNTNHKVCSIRISYFDLRASGNGDSRMLQIVKYLKENFSFPVL